ncbi:single-stranded DNA-binding protein [Luteimicrobium sp. NPDC057192]|uniref:single-stranded DNA-binding protein n=1 Tax=Luteimicrobium sp. NPDC057192 TaxID=3346042 RepID=UPI003634B37F
MSEVQTTLTGFVGDDPKHFVSATGTSFTTFRMATTRRFFDRSKGEWVDGQTLWFTVKTWRDMARNVAESLRKGDAVVATGVVGVDEWISPDGPRTSLVLEARALGPDLARGQARYTRTIHRPASDGREQDGAADGLPAAGAAAAPDDDPWASSLPELGDDPDAAGDSADAGTGEHQVADREDALAPVG